MEIHEHKQLTEQLQQLQGKEVHVSYTQWDADQDDEEVAEFRATLESIRLTDNEFEDMDLLLVFQAEDEQFEILMEIPKAEGELAAVENSRLRIFGLEAELQLSK